MAYQPLTRDPNFFEKQESLACGRHALNNFFGGRYFVKSDTGAYTYDELVTVGRELSTDMPMDLSKVCRFLQTNATTSATGGECPYNENYDISVLIYALIMAGYDVDQHDSIPEKKTGYLGFITNHSGTSIDSGHWVSVRNIDGSSNVIITDSLKGSKETPFSEYKDEFNKVPKYYRVISIKERSPENARKSIRFSQLQNITSRLQKANIKQEYVHIITGFLVTASTEDFLAVFQNPNYTINEELIQTYISLIDPITNFDAASQAVSEIIIALKGTVTKTIDVSSGLLMIKFFKDHGIDVPTNPNTIFPITENTAAYYLKFLIENNVLNKFSESKTVKQKITTALEDQVFTVYTTGLAETSVLTAWKNNMLTEKIKTKLTKSVIFEHYDQQFREPDLEGNIHTKNFTFKNLNKPFFIIDCAHCYKYNSDGTKVGLEPYQSNDPNTVLYVPQLGKDDPIVYLGYPGDDNLFNSEFFRYENGKIVTYIDKMLTKLNDTIPGSINTYGMYPNTLKDPKNLWT